MKIWRNHLEREERELKVAVCMSTFFNLNSRRPTRSELLEWLGEEYLPDIIRCQNGRMRTTAA